MIAVLLATGGTVAATKIRTTAEQLRRADPDVVLHLVSWGGAEPTGELASTIALGPYVAQAKKAAPRKASEPDEGPAPGESAPGEPEAVTATASPRPEAPSTRTKAPDQRAAVVTAAPARLRRDAVALVWKVRYSRPYQLARKAVRGGTRRRFAKKAPRSQRVVNLVRSADVVIALDTGSIPAAWKLARAIPGPAVVHGAVAGERVLRQGRQSKDATAAANAS